MFGQFVFITSGTEVSIQKRLAEFSQVTQTPVILVLQPGSQMKRYIYPESVSEITVDKIVAFVNAFKSKTLKPNFKSEAEPTEHFNIIKVVGSTYNQIV